MDGCMCVPLFFGCSVVTSPQDDSPVVRRTCPQLARGGPALLYGVSGGGDNSPVVRCMGSPLARGVRRLRQVLLVVSGVQVVVTHQTQVMVVIQVLRTLRRAPHHARVLAPAP